MAALFFLIGIGMGLAYGIIFGKHWVTLPALVLNGVVRFRAGEVGAEYRLKITEIHYEKDNYYVRLE